MFLWILYSRHLLSMLRLKLLWLLGHTRRRWRLATLISLISLLAFIYHKYRYSSASTVYVPPQTCTAADCTVQAPLEYSQLSPHLLLVFIYSSCGDGGRVRRDAIRSTWISMLDNSADSPIQYRFVLGGSNVPTKTLELLTAEANTHRDMIILEDVKNNYTSLTDRTIMAMKYASKHFRFSYLMKCDDDTFVDLLRVGTELENRHSRKLFYWGRFTKGPILLTGKFREPKWTISDDYFPYAFGGGYILSIDLVRLLAQNEPYLTRFACEDAAVGAWLAPYNIERKHDARFYTHSTWVRRCKEPYIVRHNVREDDIYLHYKSLRTEGVMCGSNYRTWRNYFVRGYIYNWTADKPSQCCQKIFGVP